MKHIKRFINEDKDNSNMSIDDLLIDLIDYGFKVDKVITNYKLRYEGEYDLSDVVELYHDSITKIKTFKDVKLTSFITKNKEVLITYEIIDKIDDDDHITISLRTGDIQLQPHSFATYTNPSNDEIYYLQVYCKNAKNNLTQVIFHADSNIISGELTHKFAGIRNFTIDKDNSAKLLKLINNESIDNHNVSNTWNNDTKAAFAKLKPEHLSNK